MAADVILLNLWAHDVGRADGQAFSVLRSVFEEAVRLYEGQAQGQAGGGDGDGGEGARGEGDEGAVVGGSARFPKVITRTHVHKQVLRGFWVPRSTDTGGRGWNGRFCTP